MMYVGLGPIPKVQDRRRSSTPKLAKYQLSPALVVGVENAVAIACGEAHALCMLSSGQVLSWGQNALGQLGVGPTKTGLLKDAFSPLLISNFGTDTQFKSQSHLRSMIPKSCSSHYANILAQEGKVKARNIFCGPFHSIVLDENGACWTWGARGSPCLGHGDSRLIGSWSSRINSLFSLSTNETNSMVPYELLPWCNKWSCPRKVKALEGISISQVQAGDLNTAFLTTDGKLLLCGSGPTIPAFYSVGNYLDVDDAEGARDQRNENQADMISAKAVVVASPRTPSSSWLREICTKKINYIAGSGGRMFVVCDEEMVARSLTIPIYRKLIARDPSHQTDSDEDSISTNRYSDYSHSKYLGILESRGKADCMVIASGHMFLCHRALLAKRSSELRDLIYMESPTDGTVEPLVQVLLPELNYEAAKALFFYLYRDILPNWVIGDVSTLSALSRCGHMLKMPRLQLLCDRFIDIISKSMQSSLNTSGMDSLAEDLPPPTLSRDLGSMIGDPEFADVRFIAEGRAVAAHRFILEARCEYFRAMFRSGMMEGYSMKSEVIDVVVPDSFVGFLRLLIFIYTDALPDGSEGALLEDLMAADRYGLADMKMLAENMLIPSKSNWLDLLRAADILHAQNLYLSVVSFLRDNFHLLRLDEFYYADKDYDEQQYLDTKMADTFVKELKEEFPSLLEDILVSRSESFPLPPSQMLIDQSTESKDAAANISRMNFPVWALVVGAVSVFLYQHVSTIVALGPVIPIVNVVATVSFAYYIFRILIK